VNIQDIPCKGIRMIESIDFEFAKELNSTIKLTGTAQRTGNELSVYVTPVVTSSGLAGIKGSGNAVAVQSSNMECLYTGPGAGRYPTANSVVADIVRVANNNMVDPFPLQTSSLVLNKDYVAMFYIRIQSTSINQCAELKALAKQHGVTIQSTKDSGDHIFAITGETNFSKVEAVCDTLMAPLFMPFIE
jgi:homoserine dehydrogenase